MSKRVVQWASDYKLLLILLLLALSNLAQIEIDGYTLVSKAQCDSCEAKYSKDITFSPNPVFLIEGDEKQSTANYYGEGVVQQWSLVRGLPKKAGHVSVIPDETTGLSFSLSISGADPMYLKGFEWPGDFADYFVEVGGTPSGKDQIKGLLSVKVKPPKLSTGAFKTHIMSRKSTTQLRARVFYSEGWTYGHRLDGPPESLKLLQIIEEGLEPSAYRPYYIEFAPISKEIPGGKNAPDPARVIIRAEKGARFLERPVKILFH